MKRSLNQWDFQLIGKENSQHVMKLLLPATKIASKVLRTGLYIKDVGKLGSS